MRFPKVLSRPALTLLCTALAGGVAVTALSACAPLLLGGAMVSGAMVGTDRRTSGAQIDDQAIELKSGRRIADAVGDRAHVNVTSYNRLVLITGEATTEADKAAIEQAVSRIDGVRSVVNELGIGAPSAIGGRSSDTIVTSKVKASMVDAKDVQANSFKVVTERGIVYLMGRVTEREAGRAADLARGVSGVRKVVKVFDVVSEAELADAPAKAVSAPASSAAP